jgi:uncharacterized protein YcbK (DUF882 family)
MRYLREKPVKIARFGRVCCRSVRVLLCLAVLFIVPACHMAQKEAPRTLTLQHAHTGEKLAVVYKENGCYKPAALKSINYFLRDIRTGDVVSVDPKLLDLLWQTRTNLNCTQPFYVLSAYRSPKTNEMLRKRSPNSGVAKKSLHMKGQAIDVRLPGISAKKLRDTALALHAGGVGYYPDSGFVHIDTGNVRQWQTRSAKSKPALKAVLKPAPRPRK